MITINVQSATQITTGGKCNGPKTSATPKTEEDNYFTMLLSILGEEHESSVSQQNQNSSVNHWQLFNEICSLMASIELPAGEQLNLPGDIDIDKLASMLEMENGDITGGLLFRYSDHDHKTWGKLNLNLEKFFELRQNHQRDFTGLPCRDNASSIIQRQGNAGTTVPLPQPGIPQAAQPEAPVAPVVQQTVTGTRETTMLHLTPEHLEDATTRPVYNRGNPAAHFTPAGAHTPEAMMHPNVQDNTTKKLNFSRLPKLASNVDTTSIDSENKPGSPNADIEVINHAGKRSVKQESNSINSYDQLNKPAPGGPERDNINNLFKQQIQLQPDRNNVPTIMQPGSNSANIPQAMQLAARLAPVIQQAANSAQGTTTLRLKLKPEHLGEVNVRLVYNQGNLQAYFTVASAHARELLEQAMVHLKENLLQLNIQLNDSFISPGDGSGSRWSQQESWQQQRQEIDFSLSGKDNPPEKPTGDAPATGFENKSLNYLV